MNLRRLFWGVLIVVVGFVVPGTTRALTTNDVIIGVGFALVLLAVTEPRP